MSAQFWSTHFGWPGGDVYGNLIAEVLGALPVIWRARVHWQRHTARQAAKHAETHQLLHDLHARLDASIPSEGEEP